MSSVLVRVEDDSGPAEARRLTVLAARDEGLPEEAVGAAGVVASEAATNIRKHAQTGEVHISRLSPFDVPGVEVLCMDRGPGMRDVEGCMADGYSTTGTPGNGMGAIQRLSSEFDAYSQPDKGTVVMARIRASKNAPPPKGWRIGAVCVPLRGEDACGDAWVIDRNNTGLKIMLADGLGHGQFAADAAQVATAAFRRAVASAPEHLLDTVHRALQGTRGAAVATAFIEKGRLRYAGLGNISGVICGGARQQFMISHNGTAGHTARHMQEFEYTLPPQGFVIMHSDGLMTSWSLDTYPGLTRCHPSVIAGVLYRDASRGRDDVCVVAVKEIGV